MIFQVLGHQGPPVKQDDVLDIRIDAIGRDGDGLAHHEGFVIFVHGLKKIGQRGTIRIKTVHPRYAVGEVMSVGETETITEEKKEEEVKKEEKEEPKEETKEETTEEKPEEKKEEETPAEEEKKEEPAIVPPPAEEASGESSEAEAKSE